MSITVSSLQEQAAPITGLGRPPAQVEIRRARAQNAWRAYHRICTMAKDKLTRQTNPRLVAELDRWLYEIEHGKPSIQIDQRVTGRIVLAPDDLTIIDAIQDNDTSLLTTSYSVVDDDPGQDSTLQNVDAQTQVDNNNNDDETL
jgi:hypothetical protein